VRFCLGCLGCFCLGCLCLCLCLVLFLLLLLLLLLFPLPFPLPFPFPFPFLFPFLLVRSCDTLALALLVARWLTVDGGWLTDGMGLIVS